LATKKETIGTVIVCRTNDEVNAALARSWCDDNAGFQLTDQRDELFCRGLRDCHRPQPPCYRAKERTPFVERLCKMCSLSCGVACYNLSPKIWLAQSSGMLLFRRIERPLFYRLVAAIDYDRAEFAA